MALRRSLAEFKDRDGKNITITYSFTEKVGPGRDASRKYAEEVLYLVDGDIMARVLLGNNKSEVHHTNIAQIVSYLTQRIGVFAGQDMTPHGFVDLIGRIKSSSKFQDLMGRAKGPVEGPLQGYAPDYQHKLFFGSFAGELCDGVYQDPDISFKAKRLG